MVLLLVILVRGCFPHSCTILHSHQMCTTVPVPHTRTYSYLFIIIIVCIVAILVGVRWHPDGFKWSDLGIFSLTLACFCDLFTHPSTPLTVSTGTWGVPCEPREAGP